MNNTPIKASNAPHTVTEFKAQVVNLGKVTKLTFGGGKIGAESRTQRPAWHGY